MRNDIIFALTTGGILAFFAWTITIFSRVHRESQQRREPWVTPTRKDNLR